jgi:hypothetical protein
VTWPQPTRKDHDTFCRIEQWRQVRDARGRTGTHHVTYELDLPDGRILRTRVSHPVDRTDYGPRLWRHILRDQLEVDEAAFWSCVHEGVNPQRGMPTPPQESLPADLVHLLISRVGLTDAEVSVMSREDAISRLQMYWSDGS